MSSLNLSIDLNFLVRSTLQQIILQSYQVTFEFDNDIRIAVESEWELLNSGTLLGRGNPQNQSGPISESQKLIGATVTNVFPKQDGTLTLVFSNNFRLVLLPCMDHEAYNISGKGIYIVV